MKRNKGFTLVELLAVIVVLAIIALIAVPSILGVIDKTKKGALKDSAYGLIDAATLYYAQYGYSARFDFDDNGNVTSNTNNKLGYKGKVENGTVIINSKGQITVCLNDGDNAAYKNYLDNNVTVVDNKNCNVPSNTYIVYLEDEATITELDNVALTSKVAELENQIVALNNTIEEQKSSTEWKVLEVSLAFTATGYNTVTYQNDALINAREVILLSTYEKVAHFVNPMLADTDRLTVLYTSNLYGGGTDDQYRDSYQFNFYQTTGQLKCGCISKGSSSTYKKITVIMYR